MARQEPPPRELRLDENWDKSDQRSRFQQDRDRIIYSSAFRRLAGVTQVVSPSEGHIFHTRLTHSLEVGQVARRIAEKLESAATGAGVDVSPDVVEAAALAHDLGHPPFGHIGEQTLDRLVRTSTEQGNEDGFEGNAQTFRILNALAVRSVHFDGLNLTRATLDAVLKYPRFSREGGTKNREKWSAYRTEETAFRFARDLHPKADESQSVEAQIMDLADDIAYAVHDVEDFYRAGLIPLERAIADGPERDAFLEGIIERNPRASFRLDIALLSDALNRVRPAIAITEPYRATRNHRAFVRSTTGALIGRYIDNVSIGGSSSSVQVPDEQLQEIFVLKQLTWHYVILNPALGALQHGQRRVLTELFEAFHRSTLSDGAILPAAYRERLREAKEVGGDRLNLETLRIPADIVAEMTEQQALEMHKRITGHAGGSVMNAILR